MLLPCEMKCDFLCIQFIVIMELNLCLMAQIVGPIDGNDLRNFETSNVWDQFIR